jgi:hypothetical protein
MLVCRAGVDWNPLKCVAGLKPRDHKRKGNKADEKANHDSIGYGGFMFFGFTGGCRKRCERQ